MTARALLTGLVDYAGLFPPAQRDMPSAVQEYAAHRAGPHAWMLGRFVVPIAQLDACAAAVEALAPRDHWKFSIVAGDDPLESVTRALAWNAAGRAVGADAIEIRAGSADAIAAIARAVAQAPLATFVEVPVANDPNPLVHALARHALCAKIRMGGVVAEAFPAPEQVLGFLRACARHGVPFKATAGLHHPLRGSYALTYAADAPRGTMYGFLNVFLAALAIADGATEAEALALLVESDPDSITMDASGVVWRDRRFVPQRIAAQRARHALSFGSCSFAEPVSDLVAMQILPPSVT